MILTDPSSVRLSSSVNKTRNVLNLGKAHISEVPLLASISLSNNTKWASYHQSESVPASNENPIEDVDESNIQSVSFNEVENNSSEHNLHSTNNNSITSFKTISQDIINQYFESHYCKSCNNIMGNQTYLPIIMDPCGHTLCAGCTIGLKKCSLCHVKISKIRHNSVLYHIILQHTSKHSGNSNVVNEQSRNIELYLKSLIPILDNSTEGTNNTKTTLLCMQSNLEMLDNKSRAIHNSLLVEECHIKNTMRQIDEKISQKQSLESEMSSMKKKHEILVDEEIQLKNGIIETRDRIKKWTTQLESVVEARNQLENRLDQVHLGLS